MIGMRYSRTVALTVENFSSARRRKDWTSARGSVIVMHWLSGFLIRRIVAHPAWHRKHFFNLFFIQPQRNIGTANAFQLFSCQKAIFRHVGTANAAEK